MTASAKLYRNLRLQMLHHHSEQLTVLIKQHEDNVDEMIAEFHVGNCPRHVLQRVCTQHQMPPINQQA